MQEIIIHPFPQCEFLNFINNDTTVIEYKARLFSKDGEYYFFFPASGNSNPTNRAYTEGTDLIIERLQNIGIKCVDIYMQPQGGQELSKGIYLKGEDVKLGDIKSFKTSSNSYLIIKSDYFNEKIFDYVVKGDNKHQINQLVNELQKMQQSCDKWSQVRIRAYQSKFRKKIRKYYQHCIISKCETEAILEAAHIVPYAYKEKLNVDINSVSNGILLRPDIHALFDRNIFEIYYDNTEDMFKCNLSNLHADIKQYEWISNVKFSLPTGINKEEFKHSLKARTNALKEINKKSS